MTESEAWLEIAEKCVGHSYGVFLCNEARRSDVCDIVQMARRLELFRPLAAHTVWWEFGGDVTQASLNDQRALACCFLAVMAEEGEGWMTSSV